MLFPEIILARILRVSKEEIKTALTETEKYQIVKRPKKKGGYRTIYIPSKPLKKLQKMILKRLLHKIQSIWHHRVYGLSPGASYVDHAYRHREAKWIFQFDLADAFPSTNISLIEKMLVCEFRQELAKLERLLEEKTYYSEKLKRVEKELESLDKVDKEKIAQELTDLVIKLTTFQGILPQGTPTAPFLFCLALIESGVLIEILKLCPGIYPESQDNYNFQIGIYVDNFVISAQKPIPDKTQKAIFEALKKLGFKINTKKIHHQRVIHGTSMITGLRIVDGKVGLSKRKIRQLRGLINKAVDPSLALEKKVEGVIASLKPIYGERLPLQLLKPYQRFLKTK